jgi:hypothetical protein
MGKLPESMAGKAISGNYVSTKYDIGRQIVLQQILLYLRHPL